MYFGATELVLPNHATIAPSSVPVNLGQVASMIAEVGGEIDGALAAAGYLAPILSPASGGPTVGFPQVVGIAKKGVSARVLSVLFPNLPGGPGSRVSMGDDYRKEYQAALQAIRQGDLPIVGAATDDSGGGRQLPRSYSTSNTAATSGVTPQTTVGMEF